MMDNRTNALPPAARSGRASGHFLVALVALAGITVAGCSSSKTLESGETNTPSTAAETTAAPETTLPGGAAATSTAPAVTTTTGPAATTTTTTAATAPLVLREAGIGPYSLGDEVAVVIDGVSAQLGAPVSDDTASYPVADGLGQYTTEDGETGYVAPMGRSVCWSVQFCAEFGGAAAASMSFTGWSYREDTTAALRSPSGVTLLTRWSDVPAINVDEGGCYSVGSGSIDGIRLTLQSEGEPFGSFDDMGNYVVGVPAPADVTVVWMETGEVPVFLYGDC